MLVLSWVECNFSVEQQKQIKRSATHKKKAHEINWTEKIWWTAKKLSWWKKKCDSDKCQKANLPKMLIKLLICSNVYSRYVYWSTRHGMARHGSTQHDRNDGFIVCYNLDDMNALFICKSFSALTESERKYSQRHWCIAFFDNKTNQSS